VKTGCLVTRQAAGPLQGSDMGVLAWKGMSSLPLPVTASY